METTHVTTYFDTRKNRFDTQNILSSSLPDSIKRIIISSLAKMSEEENFRILARKTRVEFLLALILLMISASIALVVTGSIMSKNASNASPNVNNNLANGPEIPFTFLVFTAVGSLVGICLFIRTEVERRRRKKSLLEVEERHLTTLRENLGTFVSVHPLRTPVRVFCFKCFCVYRFDIIFDASENLHDIENNTLNQNNNKKEKEKDDEHFEELNVTSNRPYDSLNKSDDEHKD